jgi:hypothetical protein
VSPFGTPDAPPRAKYYVKADPLGEVTGIGLQRFEKPYRPFHGLGLLPTKLGRALISTKRDGEPVLGVQSVL